MSEDDKIKYDLFLIFALAMSALLVSISLYYFSVGQNYLTIHFTYTYANDSVSIGNGNIAQLARGCFKTLYDYGIYMFSLAGSIFGISGLGGLFYLRKKPVCQLYLLYVPTGVFLVFAGIIVGQLYNNPCLNPDFPFK